MTEEGRRPWRYVHDSRLVRQWFGSEVSSGLLPLIVPRPVVEFEPVAAFDMSLLPVERSALRTSSFAATAAMLAPRTANWDGKA